MDAQPCPRARWFVRGDKEKHDYAIGELYAAVAHVATLRLFLIITAVPDLEIGQVDVVAAFLNSQLWRVRRVVQPKVHEDGTGHVCKLKRALSGLPEFPIW